MQASRLAYHRNKVGDALYQRVLLPDGLPKPPAGVSRSVELHLRSDPDRSDFCERFLSAAVHGGALHSSSSRALRSIYAHARAQRRTARIYQCVTRYNDELRCFDT